MFVGLGDISNSKSIVTENQILKKAYELIDLNGGKKSHPDWYTCKWNITPSSRGGAGYDVLNQDVLERFKKEAKALLESTSQPISNGYVSTVASSRPPPLPQENIVAQQAADKNGSYFWIVAGGVILLLISRQ